MIRIKLQNAILQLCNYAMHLNKKVFSYIREINKNYTCNGLNAIPAGGSQVHKAAHQSHDLLQLCPLEGRKMVLGVG